MVLKRFVIGGIRTFPKIRNRGEYHTPFYVLKALLYYEAEGTMEMPRRNELEYKALHWIVNNGNDGVLQSDLWRKLEATSREGSRIALKLETKGLIRREKELSEGRWTYRLYPKRKPASLNSIINSPCLMCTNDARCGAWNAISPNECQKLTQWLLDSIREETESSGEA
jgi:hypothetical protein